MSCNCNCNILKSTASSAVSGTVLLLTPTTTLAPQNEGKVKILVSSDTPSAGTALPVSIVLNGANVPVLDRYANLIYGYRLRRNMILYGYFGNDGITNEPHYIVTGINRLNCCGCN
jgi:hypothetical protein